MREVSKFAAGSAIVAVAAFASAGLAQADGMPRGRAAVVYEKPANWSGFYFGAHGGYSWSNYDNTYLAPGPNNRWESDSDTFLVGGHIGIQHQFGQIVLGVEANLSSVFKDQTNEVDCPNPATNCVGRFTDVVTIGPRLGWAMGKYMPYLTGGYANAAFDHSVTLKTTGVTTREAHDRTDGWYIGAGFDMALSHGWTIGLEYRHYEFEGFNSDRHTPAGVLDPGDRAAVDVNLDTVTVRASWKFGREEARPLK